MHNENKLLEIFVNKYSILSKFAIMIVKDEDAALDVIQNVALIIAAKSYHLSEIKKPTAFLITCVRRAAFNYLREESKTYPTDPSELAGMHGGEYSRAALDYLEWVIMLKKYLEPYSPQLQNAFIKHYVDGYPLDTVAEDLNMAPNSLAQQLRRMRKKTAQKSPEIKVLLMLLSYL